jgi:colicin V production protein
MFISELIFIGLLALGGIMGFRKGLIAQVSMFLALLLGIWAAIHFSEFTGRYLSAWFNLQGDNAFLASFVVTFAAVVLLVYFVGKFASRLLKVMFLGWVDKLAGLLLGILKMALLLSVVLVILHRTGVSEKLFSEEQRSAIFYRNLEKFAPTIYPSLRDLGYEMRQQLDIEE